MTSPWNAGYVAATGLPEKRADHAIAMSRFATDCLTKFQTLAKELEKSLGPDTGDLDVRIGVHSGPGRFQWIHESARVLLFAFLSLILYHNSLFGQSLRAC